MIGDVPSVPVEPPEGSRGRVRAANVPLARPKMLSADVFAPHRGTCRDRPGLRGTFIDFESSPPPRAFLRSPQCSLAFAIQSRVVGSTMPRSASVNRGAANPSPARIINAAILIRRSAAERSPAIVRANLQSLRRKLSRPACKQRDARCTYPNKLLRVLDNLSLRNPPGLFVQLIMRVGRIYP